MFDAERLACFRQDLLERPEHQRQRRAELVADIAEECGLGAIDLGQRLRALAFLLIGARAGQADGDLFRDAANELTVAVVEGAARMDADHEEAGRLTALAQPNRRRPSRACGGDGQPGMDRRDGALAKIAPPGTSSASAVLNRQRLSLRQSMSCRMQAVVGRDADTGQTRLLFAGRYW